MLKFENYFPKYRYTLESFRLVWAGRCYSPVCLRGGLSFFLFSFCESFVPLVDLRRPGDFSVQPHPQGGACIFFVSIMHFRLLFCADTERGVAQIRRYPYVSWYTYKAVSLYKAVKIAWQCRNWGNALRKRTDVNKAAFPKINSVVVLWHRTAFLRWGPDPCSAVGGATLVRDTK